MSQLDKKVDGYWGFTVATVAAAVAVGAVVTGLAASWTDVRDLLRSVGVPPTLSLVCVAGATVLVLAGVWLRQRQRFRVHLKHDTRVGRAKPSQFGVHASPLAVDACGEIGSNGEPPRVPCPGIDEELQTVLSNPTTRLVIVTADRYLGTSRTIFENVKITHGDARLLVPATPPRWLALDPAAALLQAVAPPGYLRRGSIVFIDHCGSRLASGDFTADMIDRYVEQHPGSVVVATMTAEEYEALNATDGAFGDATRSLYDAATVVRMPETMSASIAEIRELYPRLRGDVTRLPRKLMRADEVERRAAHARAHLPVAHAVMRATTDFYRGGGRDPVPRAYLEAAHVHYLDGALQRRDATTTAHAFDEALEWLQDDTAAGVALLTQTDGGFETPDLFGA